VTQRLCALLLALACGWGVHAAAGGHADTLGEAEIARLAELSFQALPLAGAVGMVAAREPAWPFQARPDAVDARQLACVRARMDEDHLRQALLERTRRHARADPEGMRDGLRFLEDDGAKLFREIMTRSVSAAADGHALDVQALEASAPAQQRQALLTLLVDRRYRPLRALFGMPEQSRHDHDTGLASGAAMVKVLLAPVLLDALEACAVPLSAFDDPGPAAARP